MNSRKITSKNIDMEKMNISQIFFFTTDVSDIRMDYSSLTKVLNDSDVIIYPIYRLNGKDVRMDGIKADSPAIYVDIIDSIIKYCEAAGESKDTEKKMINALCNVLRLSNDRKEAIADLGECADGFDFEPEKSHIEDAQAALMDYLPVFYDTTESAYAYYCNIMRLTPDVELEGIRYAFHSLMGAMNFLKNMAKITVKECVEIMASATFRDVNRADIAKNVAESLRDSMDGIRDFNDSSRSAIESIILALDGYVANPDKALWVGLWKNHIRLLRDNLFRDDKEIRDTITDVLKKLGLPAKMKTPEKIFFTHIKNYLKNFFHLPLP